MPLLGAVGPLQFEVVQYRMQTEYGAESRLEAGSWKILRWVSPDTAAKVDAAQLPTGARLAADAAGQTVILFNDQWSCEFFAERNAASRLSPLPCDAASSPVPAAAASPGDG